jgi:hypothetical protein
MVDNRAYLLAELADNNLDSFLAKSPGGENATGPNREWLRSQFRGLAGALVTIHGPIGPDFITPYHHDVIPENVLVFNRTTTNSKPTLKLID